MHCVEGLNLTDYTCAIGDLVNPENILGVCLFLSSKELVQEITDNQEYLEIQQQKVNIRPLIARQKRVIFSNVPLNIPNFILDDILNKLKVRRYSPLSSLVNFNNFCDFLWFLGF